MPDWLQLVFDVLSQFTGGADDSGHVLVDEIIACGLWGVLIFVSVFRHRRRPQNNEALLRWGFGIALARELFAIAVELNDLSSGAAAGQSRPYFPPFEHTLGCLSQIVITAGFMRAMFSSSGNVTWFLRSGVAVTALSYAVTFWWWRAFALSNADARFETVWCNTVFHVTAVVFTAIAAILVSRHCKGGIRRVVCVALVLLFFWDFLKIMDMAMGGEFSSMLHPLSRIFRLGAISGFVLVYLLDALAKRAEAERIASNLQATLELRVMERTLELEEAQEWRRRAELDEQRRTREALKMQHVLFELAKLDKSDFEAAICECLRSASDAIRVARVSYWVTSAGGGELTCRYLHTMASESIDTKEIKLSADRFPAYFKAIARMTQIVADDAQSCEDTREFTERYLAPLGITALLDVPVWHKGSLHGLVSFEHCGSPRKWTQAELDFSHSIADIIAQCVESRGRLLAERQLARAHERKSAISELEAAINREEDIQCVLNRIAETVTKFLPSAAASVVLWDAESESFSVSASTVPGQPAQAGAERVRRQGGASRAIVDTLRPVVTPDIRKDPHGANRLLDQFGMLAYAGVPMHAHGVVLGVLYAIDRDVRDYSDDDLGFLTSAAAQASAALWQFRLNSAIRETNIKLANEIKERRRALEGLAASLREKEVLMQEIHHRVKNNLQLVSSLLNLQAAEYDDPNVRLVFTESQQRIRTMALIHEMLYQSDDLTDIDFADYLRRLVPGLMRACNATSLHVTHKIEADSVFLSPRMAIPLALVVNELITNSLKYAFPDGKGGLLSILLKRDGAESVTLTVRDNGIGLPADFDMKRADSLGLRLVGMMALQVSAELTFVNAGGTQVTLTFSSDSPRNGEGAKTL